MSRLADLNKDIVSYMTSALATHSPKRYRWAGKCVHYSPACCYVLPDPAPADLPFGVLLLAPAISHALGVGRGDSLLQAETSRLITLMTFPQQLSGMVAMQLG